MPSDAEQASYGVRRDPARRTYFAGAMAGILGCGIAVYRVATAGLSGSTSVMLFALFGLLGAVSTYFLASAAVPRPIALAPGPAGLELKYSRRRNRTLQWGGFRIRVVGPHSGLTAAGRKSPTEAELWTSDFPSHSIAISLEAVAAIKRAAASAGLREREVAKEIPRMGQASLTTVSTTFESEVFSK